MIIRAKIRLDLLECNLYGANKKVPCLDNSSYKCLILEYNEKRKKDEQKLVEKRKINAKSHTT